jgi:plastocyanin
MRGLPLVGALALVAAFAVGETLSRVDAVGAATSAASAAVTGTVSGKVTVVENAAVAANREIVLYIVGPPHDDAPPSTAEIVATDDLRFIPDLLVVTVGDSVAFPNRGVKMHNVYSPAPRFYLDLKPGESKAQRFTERGVVEAYCNLHPTEAATIIVAPNRHHAHTNDGAFRIDNVPVGDWELFAYTRRAIKPARTKISVTPKGIDVELSITLGAAAVQRGPR